jgi:Beta-propeller repeat
MALLVCVFSLTGARADTSSNNRLDMKPRTIVLFPVLFCGMLAAGTSEDAVRILGTAPLRFEPAADNGSSQFIARGPRFRYSFAGNEATFQSRDKQVRLQFQGAAPGARIEAIEKLSSTTGLFLGNNPTKWRPEIPNYGRLQIRDLYRGVDLVYYGNEDQLEYDLTVKPGADPRSIRLRLDASRARVDRDGNLVAGLIQKRPVAYQVSADGSRTPVESRYRRNADGTYGFVVGKYDRDHELVIDPVLTFSLYLSGSNQDIAQTIGLDKIGFLYVAGTTYSTNFPIVSGFQATQGGGTDIFVAKIDPNAKAGAQVVFSTYIGGTANETLGGMSVGPNGDVYLTGTTLSSNFPTVNPAQTALDGTSDAFVVWINSSRALGYSTYLGGALDETGVGITFNSKHEIFVTGGTESTDFPKVNAFQTSSKGRQDAFVAAYNPGLSGTATLIYSSYLGGSDWDIGRGVALAADGTVWIAGGTYSYDFPLKGNSRQTVYRGEGDAFVAHINISAGSSGLEYTSFLGGGNQEEASNIVINSAGQVVVSGWTISPTFPITANGMQPVYGGNGNGFVSILDTTKAAGEQLIYSTFFGGTGPTIPSDLKQDAEGNLYLCGYTLADGLPTTKNAAQPAYDGSVDAFVLEFNPATAGPAAISYFSYLGSDGLQVGNGVAFDAKGDIYVVGYTSGPIFKALHGVAKTSDAGKVDGFVAGLSTK